jgi:hypothetical protein
VFRTNLTAFKRELQQEIESAAPFLKTQDGGTAYVLEETPYDCDSLYLDLIAVLEPRENAALVSEFLVHMSDLVTHPACETINYRPDLIPREVVRKAFEITLDSRANYGWYDLGGMVDVSFPGTKIGSGTGRSSKSWRSPGITIISFR